MPTSVNRGPLFAGVSLQFNFPNAESVKRQLAVIEDYLEDTLPLAETAKAALQVDMARRFDTETDPDGRKWADLVRPAFDQIAILQLTGDMRSAALDEASWTATPVGVYFDTSNLDTEAPYWKYQDIGSSHIPRGPRTFIGAGEQEANRIERMGDEWLARGIMLGGVFREEARAPAGTFMKIR